MAMTWTDAQRAAIDTKDQTLLVSAAAGAGKTAALTERLIRRLTDKETPAHIDRMLIVTFTRAAASELRERIAKALSEALARDPGSRHLSEQIVRLSEAKICTIDAFFLDVVRSNFALVGLPPKFRMADNAELTVLKNSVMNETIERFYRKGNEYGRFFDHFSKVRSDRNLAEVFLSLYSDLGRHPEGLSFLKKNAQTMRDGAEQDYFSTPFGAVSRRYTESLLDAAISMFENALAYAVTYEPMDKAYTPFFSEELAFCRTLRETVRGGDYSASRELLLSYAPRRIATIKKGTATEDTERYKELRKKFNDDIRAMKKDRFLLSAPDIRRAMLDSADVSERLYELLTAYDEHIRTEKLRRAICDFDDVRLHTYALLVDENGAPTPLARSYAEHFDEIYIDEYQDVDSIQDLIFRAIAKPNNRFLVGDIKQSIYGFRGANPDVFASYRERFPKYGSEDAKDSPASAIYMSDNFRCDSPIIRFTNTVCGTVFATCEGGLAYRPEDDLIASKKLSDGYVPHKAEVVLLSSEAKKAHADAEKNGEAVDPLPPMAEESEAAYITARIRALLKNGTKADGTPILPRDIAILSRSGSTLKTVAAELGKAGIETCISAEETFFENPEVLLLLSLLNTIDNPRRDVYLAATLRSPLYGFTLEELVRIRKEADSALSLYDALLAYRQKHPSGITARKADHFTTELDAYRAVALTLPVDRLIRHIFGNPRLTAGGGLSSGLPESRHLLRLYEYARKFEAGAFRGLCQFVSYVERLIADNAEMDLPEVENDHAVKLMTIHKSKGLEFPVVFLANARKRFNLKDSEEPILIEESIGVAMKLSDESGFAKLNTPMRDAIGVYTKEKNIEEEMRVLYVALTRARERLIVTTRPFGVSSMEERIRSRAISPSRHSVMECRSYAEWILYALSLLPNGGEDFVTVTTVESVSIPPTVRAARAETEKNEYTEREVEAYLSRFREAFSYRYPHGVTARLPAKLSVSRLYPGVLDEAEEDAATLPTFAGDEDNEAAKRGTATHCFLQFCDFARAKRSGAAEECARLAEHGFLSREDAALCRTEELDAFFESAFFSRLAGAKKIYREQRFNIFLPASHFTEDAETAKALQGEKILVQGVIDLFFLDENGRLILCDYKTDRLSPSEQNDDNALAAKMKHRHGEQLSYYALALRELLGKAPDEILVYATAAGRAVKIEI